MTIIEEAIIQLNLFLTSKPRNRWLSCDNAEVYVRKGVHFIDCQIRETLDIATINIAQSQRGRGIGTRLINEFHKISPYKYTMIESILNLDFYLHLKRDEWIDIPGTVPPSVYKVKE